jgi:hypothetical protein
MGEIERNVDFYYFNDDDHKYIYDKISELINDPENETLKELEDILTTIKSVSEEIVDIATQMHELQKDRFEY